MMPGSIQTFGPQGHRGLKGSPSLLAALALKHCQLGAHVQGHSNFSVPGLTTASPGSKDGSEKELVDLAKFLHKHMHMWHLTVVLGGGILNQGTLPHHVSKLRSKRNRKEKEPNATEKFLWLNTESLDRMLLAVFFSDMAIFSGGKLNWSCFLGP